MSSLARAMSDAVERLQRDLAALDPGRAHPSLLDGVKVTAYGAELPVAQVAQVSAQPPRGLLVVPHDPSIAGAVERALAQANLGAMPTSDGPRIRLELPAPTAERREQLARTARERAEAARVAIRLARRDRINQLKRDAAAGTITEARKSGRTKDAQAATDDHIAQVDAALAAALKRLAEV